MLNQQQKHDAASLAGLFLGININALAWAVIVGVCDHYMGWGLSTRTMVMVYIGFLIGSAVVFTFAGTFILLKHSDHDDHLL